jgi:hypothetical protein
MMLLSDHDRVFIAATTRRNRQLAAGRACKKREYQRKRDVILARTKAWRDANLDTARAISADWRARNPDLVVKSKKEWYERTREHNLARARRRLEDLTDGVVRSRFTTDSDLASKDIPDAMIPLIRTTILIRRELRQRAIP